MKRITLLITFISLLCISIKAQEYYNVTVHINAGELKDSLTKEQLSRVQDLLVSGSMNYDDLALIQNNMPKLKYVNLRNVDLDTIPKRAFYENKSIELFKLPLHIEYLGDASFAGSNIQLEVTGEFPGFGEGVGASGILISPDNEFCKVIRNCVYSTDGKVMYRCLHADLLVWIEMGTEVIADRAFEGLGLRCMYFPSTLLKIEENVFENAYIIHFDHNDRLLGPITPNCIYFESKYPPSLAKDMLSSGTDHYTPNCFIRIPKDSKKLYQEADLQWKIFETYEEDETKPYFLMIQTHAGKLKDALTKEQLQRVQNLAVLGSLNDDDLSLMRNKMPELTYANLRDVDLDTIPAKAFEGNKKMKEFRLPLHIRYLGNFSFAESDTRLTVTGPYPRFGDGVGARGIDISSDNEYCQIINKGIYSADGKTIYYCDSEKLEIRVEEGTEIIASRAFQGVAIRRVYFPSTLLKIEDNIFKYAYYTGYVGEQYYSDPAYMSFESQYPPSLAKDVLSLNDYTRSCHIWVPKGSRKLYKEADPQWNLYNIYEVGEEGPSEIKTISKDLLSVRIVGSSLTVNSQKAISCVEVFDSLGKMVISETYNTPDVTIPLTSQYKTIYFVRVSFCDHTFETVKVIN